MLLLKWFSNVQDHSSIVQTSNGSVEETFLPFAFLEFIENTSKKKKKLQVHTGTHSSNDQRRDDSQCDISVFFSQSSFPPAGGTTYEVVVKVGGTCLLRWVTQNLNSRSESPVARYNVLDVLITHVLQCSTFFLSAVLKFLKLHPNFRLLLIRAAVWYAEKLQRTSIALTRHRANLKCFR